MQHPGLNGSIVNVLVPEIKARGYFIDISSCFGMHSVMRKGCSTDHGAIYSNIQHTTECKL